MVNNQLRIVIMAFVSLLVLNGVVESAPIVENIFPSPSDPSPRSSVTFTAWISPNNSAIDDIFLILEEYDANSNVIYGHNISMKFMYGCCMDFYQAKIKINGLNTTNLKYLLNIYADGNWKKYEYYGTNVSHNNCENGTAVLEESNALFSNNSQKAVAEEYNKEDTKLPGFTYSSSVAVILFVILIYYLKNK